MGSGRGGFDGVADLLAQPLVLRGKPQFVALGVDWSTSDYGRGKLSVRSHILRLVCMNGATMQDTLGEVHLGGRLADNIEFSNRTLELDTKTTASAMRDASSGN